VRYYISLDPNLATAPVVVDLTELPNGSLEAQVDGRTIDIDAVPVGSRLSVRVDGKIVDLTTEGVPPDLGVVANGHRSYVRVQSERMRSAEQAKSATVSASDRVVKSPMPGRVVKVLVAEGDTVAAGQGLVVLEAMKMENEVRARGPGKVAHVHVKPGATVEGNAKLVTLA
jgi:glutaconyl-CoA/methylmalonyl-CoA decarboxylase subunit gamma